LPDYIRHLDEPITDSAGISLYYISKLAKDYVTVVLSGEGADELFAGYDFYYYMRVIQNLRKLIGPFTSEKILPLISELLPNGKIRKYVDILSHPFEASYHGIRTYDERNKFTIYNKDMKSLVKKFEKNHCLEFIDSLFRKTNGNDLLSRMLYFDCKTWLVDNLLIKADRMSMANSLELRVPFLDHRLVELAATIPSIYKLRGRKVKYLLKKFVKGLLPPEVIYRKKMGFPTPLRIMLQQNLHPIAQERLLSPKSHTLTFFSSKVITKVLKKHKDGIQDYSRLIWQLLVLEEWMRQFGGTSG